MMGEMMGNHHRLIVVHFFDCSHYHYYYHYCVYYCVYYQASGAVSGVVLPLEPPPPPAPSLVYTPPLEIPVYRGTSLCVCGQH